MSAWMRTADNGVGIGIKCRTAGLLIAAALAFAAPRVSAQEAKWIWTSENDKNAVPAGAVCHFRKSFDIKAQPDAAMRRADRVEMIPKRKQVKQGLEKLELWIDRETVMMIQMRLSFPGGDQKTIALSDLAVDVPLADDAFRP